MSRPLKRQRAIYALPDDQPLIRGQAAKHGKTISGYLLDLALDDDPDIHPLHLSADEQRGSLRASAPSPRLMQHSPSARFTSLPQPTTRPSAPSSTSSSGRDASGTTPRAATASSPADPNKPRPTPQRFPLLAPGGSRRNRSREPPPANRQAISPSPNAPLVAMDALARAVAARLPEGRSRVATTAVPHLAGTSSNQPADPGNLPASPTKQSGKLTDTSRATAYKGRNILNRLLSIVRSRTDKSLFKAVSVTIPQMSMMDLVPFARA